MKTSLVQRTALAVALSAALAVPFVPAQAMDMMERIVSTQTTLIRYEATEYQRKVAEANARAYMKTQVEKEIAHHSGKSGKSAKTAKSETSTESTKTHKPSKSTETAESAKASEAETKTAKQEVKKKLPRYVAIDTVKDKRASKGTKKVVMIWDTQSESLVNNDVYDVQAPPAVGSTAKFDTYSAQYVGNGL